MTTGTGGTPLLRPPLGTPGSNSLLAPLLNRPSAPPTSPRSVIDIITGKNAPPTFVPKLPPPPIPQLPLGQTRRQSRQGGRSSLVSGGLNVTPALTSPRALTGN